LLQGLSDQLVYEGVQGRIAIEPDDIKRLGMGKHLRLSKSAAPDASDHPELFGTWSSCSNRRLGGTDPDEVAPSAAPLETTVTRKERRNP